MSTTPRSQRPSSAVPIPSSPAASFGGAARGGGRVSSTVLAAGGGNAAAGSAAPSAVLDITHGNGKESPRTVKAATAYNKSFVANAEGHYTNDPILAARMNGAENLLPPTAKSLLLSPKSSSSPRRPTTASSANTCSARPFSAAATSAATSRASLASPRTGAAHNVLDVADSYGFDGDAARDYPYNTRLVRSLVEAPHKAKETLGDAQLTAGEILSQIADLEYNLITRKDEDEAFAQAVRDSQPIPRGKNYINDNDPASAGIVDSPSSHSSATANRGVPSRSAFVRAAQAMERHDRTADAEETLRARQQSDTLGTTEANRKAVWVTVVDDGLLVKRRELDPDAAIMIHNSNNNNNNSQRQVGNMLGGTDLGLQSPLSPAAAKKALGQPDLFVKLSQTTPPAAEATMPHDALFFAPVGERFQYQQIVRDHALRSSQQVSAAGCTDRRALERELADWVEGHMRREEKDVRAEEEKGRVAARRASRRARQIRRASRLEERQRARDEGLDEEFSTSSSSSSAAGEEDRGRLSDDRDTDHRSQRRQRAQKVTIGGTEDAANVIHTSRLRAEKLLTKMQEKEENELKRVDAEAVEAGIASGNNKAEESAEYGGMNEDAWVAMGRAVNVVHSSVEGILHLIKALRSKALSLSDVEAQLSSESARLEHTKHFVVSALRSNQTIQNQSENAARSGNVVNVETDESIRAQQWREQRRALLARRPLPVAEGGGGGGDFGEPGNGMTQSGSSRHLLGQYGSFMKGYRGQQHDGPPSEGFLREVDGFAVRHGQRTESRRLDKYNPYKGIHGNSAGRNNGNFSPDSGGGSGGEEAESRRRRASLANALSGRDPLTGRAPSSHNHHGATFTAGGSSNDLGRSYSIGGGALGGPSYWGGRLSEYQFGDNVNSIVEGASFLDATSNNANGRSIVVGAGEGSVMLSNGLSSPMPGAAIGLPHNKAATSSTVSVTVGGSPPTPLSVQMIQYAARAAANGASPLSPSASGVVGVASSLKGSLKSPTTDFTSPKKSVKISPQATGGGGGPPKGKSQKGSESAAGDRDVGREIELARRAAWQSVAIQLLLRRDRKQRAEMEAMRSEIELLRSTQRDNQNDDERDGGLTRKGTAVFKPKGDAAPTIPPLSTEIPIDDRTFLTSVRETSCEDDSSPSSPLRVAGVTGHGPGGISAEEEARRSPRKQLENKAKETLKAGRAAEKEVVGVEGLGDGTLDGLAATAEKRTEKQEDTKEDAEAARLAALVLRAKQKAQEKERDAMVQLIASSCAAIDAIGGGFYAPVGALKKGRANADVCTPNTIPSDPCLINHAERAATAANGSGRTFSPERHHPPRHFTTHSYDDRRTTPTFRETRTAEDEAALAHLRLRGEGRGHNSGKGAAGAASTTAPETISVAEHAPLKTPLTPKRPSTANAAATRKSSLPLDAPHSSAGAPPPPRKKQQQPSSLFVMSLGGGSRAPSVRVPTPPPVANDL